MQTKSWRVKKIANVFWTSFTVGPLSADRKNTNYIFRTRLNFIHTCAEAGHYIQNRAASKLSSSHLVPLFHQQSVSLMGVYHFFIVQYTDLGAIFCYSNGFKLQLVNQGHVFYSLMHHHLQLQAWWFWYFLTFVLWSKCQIRTWNALIVEINSE